MKSYSYIGQDAKGNVVRSRANAENEQEFLQKMKERGVYIREYQEDDSDTSRSIYKFSTKELSFCCRQLSAMLTSGLTLVKAIDILTKEQTNAKARAIWQDVYENVQKGESFSSTLEMHSGSFPEFLISMVGAGESSGSLDVIMQRMSDHYTKENKLKNVVRSAMVYPIILAVVAVGITIFLFTAILPRFLEMYEDPNDMPALTRILAAGSEFLRTKWFLLIAIIGGIVLGFAYLMKTPDFRLKYDRFILKGPGFGPLVTKIYTGRFARTLSSLYSSGIPMVECLQRSSDVLANSYISSKFEEVVDEVKQGESLSASITRTEIFENMFCSIIYVGEESGALDTILEKTADYYEDESESAVKRLVGMVEPILIVFMGIMIGLIVGGIYPALYGAFGEMENQA